MLRNFTKILQVQKAKLSAAAAPAPQTNPEILYTGLFINNEWVKSSDGKTFTTENPATEKVIAEVQQAGKADVDKAVKAAKDAFKLGSPWRRMDASERGYLLNRLADLIDRDKVYIASLETLDNGKPYTASYYGDSLETLDNGKPYTASYYGDVTASANNLRYYAGWADKNHGYVLPTDGNYFAYTRHEPVGVCGQIIPWNFPLLMASWKLGPALATGNTIILKPAEQTPLTALYLAQLRLCVCGQIIPWNFPLLMASWKLGPALATGNTIILKPAEQTPLTALYLAQLVKVTGYQRVDTAYTLRRDTVMIFSSRTFVEESIYDKFVEMSAERAKKRVVGDPFNLATEQGPQVDKEQHQQILKLIESGKNQGAKLVTGGGRAGSVGHFIQPTVFSDVKDDMDIARYEIFGPVQQIMKFSKMDELIQRANDTHYGLAAAIFSKDLDKTNYLIQGLRAGTIWVNDYNVFGNQVPFGGYKQSGLGRENGPYGIKNYTEVKAVVVKVTEKNS
ncbi:Aldehyde dehydrogenase, mitochondrial [Papilio machaon]|uniref:aldehyde dehydrogenase (NAD(+)) n=1 Tax=Papilio machaon TaxID=76193 RepID=A0A194RIN5_PAPMA|nr:Aldehyde dehydrogenase, mitochondrial [Papilio machaon]